ncbi:PREDICTED: uncharacterized protein At1g43920, Chloroplastic-like [Camelina sativa]|uniref:Uncharacterized protein At1g43920, Chloroplastic-like n=1 Tax=Camelina sativa TaxID=90675 RepID=A0ABM1QHK5_CAMSA|nr:PREDICTED: uncharacterized protein At1g43920, Chloroplastic-like [Camelina sativa]
MSSSSETLVIIGDRGLPSKCVCGERGHLFKWVEDAIYEEVEDALPKLGIMANEIVKAKAEINELNVAMQELKEDAMQRKRVICKLKRLWKMCFLWLCVITI